MTAHRFHPDPARMEIEALLYDDCPRCDDQAEHLVGLDNQRLGFLWGLMLRRADNQMEMPRSLTVNENKALDRLYESALVFERLTDHWPSIDVLTRIRYQGIDG